MKRIMNRKRNSGQEKAFRKRRSGLKVPGECSESEMRQTTAPRADNNQQEHSVNTNTLSSEVTRSTDALQDSQSDVASEISSLASSRSHESLSFIRGKALYNLAQEMNALADEFDLDDATNEKVGGFMISGSLSDDDIIDDLQRELANADQEFGDIFDWDGKSIIVVEAESDSPENADEGTTDVPRDRIPLNKIISSDFQPHSRAEPQDTNHPALISMDEGTAGLQHEKATNTQVTYSQHSKLTRMESNDFQPPAHSEQEHEIHLAPVSLKESTEGLQEESSRSKQQRKPAARQLEELLAVVQEENRALKMEMDQIQESRTKEEAEYDTSMQEVENKLLNLMTRLRDKQMQYNAAVKQARDERASLEQHLQDKEEQIQKLSTRFQQITREEESRRQKLEKALATVQKDLERVDSVTSDMVHELDDASSRGSSPSLHNSRSWRDADSWSATSPQKGTLIRKDSVLSAGSDKIPEALTINHVLHMCQSPPKVSRLSSKSLHTPPNMVGEIKLRNEKAVQVLTELKAKVRNKKPAKEKKNAWEEIMSIALDYGQSEPDLVNANVKDLNGNHHMLLSQFDQESDLLNKQMSVQREIIARLETKHKTIVQTSRERYNFYENELFELKATYDEQLATFANENESLNHKLTNVTTSIDQLKSRHKQEISSLKKERHEIEKEVLQNSVAVSNPDSDGSKQENEPLSRQLIQYNEALDKLRSQHEEDIQIHEASQKMLVEELKKLQSKYEGTVGSFYRQKEILMKKLISKERAVAEIEVTQEKTLKDRQEEKQQLEEQLQALDERCIKMKKARAELLHAQKQKFELLSLQLKGLKAMREKERITAKRRISVLEEKLDTIQSDSSQLLVSPKKSDYEVAAEASDTSRTSCLDPMADDYKAQETRMVATAAGRLPRHQLHVGARRTVILLVVILLIWASIQQIQNGFEERDSLNHEIESLQAEVNEWKMQATHNDAMKATLRHSLDEATSASMGHKREAMTLAEQLDQLLVKHEVLQQEHDDYLVSYLRETSHDPLPRCFDSPTLAMVAALEEQLDDVIEKHGDAETQVEPLDEGSPLLEDGLSEESQSRGVQEASTSPVAKSRDSVVSGANSSGYLMDTQATVFELSKAGLEAEVFLLETLAGLSQPEGFFECERLNDILRLLCQRAFFVTDMLDENVAELRSSIPVLQDDMTAKASLFRDRAVTVVQQLKNKLLPQHRRLMKSEEGVWLDL
ncbi:MAG: hypothetical protein SGBAC_007647 [Bacillariaceae sp.]